MLDGLTLARFVIEVPREVLRERIAARFRTHAGGRRDGRGAGAGDLDPALPAARIIGRRELLALHDGALTEAEAIEKAVIASRQYAKRQDTWFRNQLSDWTRIDGAEGGNIIAETLKYL